MPSISEFHDRIPKETSITSFIINNELSSVLKKLELGDFGTSTEVFYLQKISSICFTRFNSKESRFILVKIR